MAAATTTPRKPAVKRPPVEDHKPKASEVQKAVATDGKVTVTLHDQEWTVTVDALDDYDLLEDLTAFDKGDVSRLAAILNQFLGEEQHELAKDAVRGENGRVKASDMAAFFYELVQAVNPNS